MNEVRMRSVVTKQKVVVEVRGYVVEVASLLERAE